MYIYCAKKEQSVNEGRKIKKAMQKSIAQGRVESVLFLFRLSSFHSHISAQNREEQKGNVQNAGEERRVARGKGSKKKRDEKHQGREEHSVPQAAKQRRVTVDPHGHKASQKGGDKRGENSQGWDQACGILGKIGRQGGSKQESHRYQKGNGNAF